MRRCESCHDAADSHSDWLPYTSRHHGSAGLRKLPYPAAVCAGHRSRRLDGAEGRWVGQSPNAAASRASSTVTGLVTGYKPVLMQRTNVDGDTLLAPYNLITRGIWVYDDRQRRQLPGAPDRPGSGLLLRQMGKPTRLRSWRPLMPTATASWRERAAHGQRRPRRTLVAAGWRRWGWTTRASRARCSRTASTTTSPAANGRRATASAATATIRWSRADAVGSSVLPGGVTPDLRRRHQCGGQRQIVECSDGALTYQPATERDGIYVFGHNRVRWVDWLGALVFVGVLLAVARPWRAALPGGPAPAAPWHGRRKRVYMYQAYERFWHWLQTITISSCCSPG